MPPAVETTAVIESVLLETDSPDLLLARDAVGTQYLCCLVSRDLDGDRFIAVPMSPSRVAEFRSGALDLRSVFTRPENGMRFRGTFHPVKVKPAIVLTPLQDIPDEWLPQEGFLLSDFTDAISDEVVVRDALAKNAAVVICRLNPPEARDGKIDADHLAEGVRAFQSLVKYAHRRAAAMMSSAAKMRLEPDAHVLRTYGFSGGSFQVHFESKQQADLIGRSPIGAALETIDA